MLSPSTSRPTSDGIPGPLELTLAGDPGSVTRARTALADYAEAAGADREGVELAVAEAVGNAVLHAFGDGEDGTIRVRATAVADRLLVEISDDGTGIQPDLAGRRAGLGLPIIGGLAASLDVRSGANGTRVSIRFPLADE